MTIKEMHREAMKYAQDAFVARQSGDETTAISLYRKAFLLEKEAALSLLSQFDKEPTRSVLFRSAASLAYKCDEFLEAEKMASQGLAGNPPAEIAEELRNLFEDINLGRHLEISDTKISSTELQFSLIGNEVGFGTVNSDEFLDRYKSFELLTYRTAERLLRKPYRTAGKLDPKIKNNFQPYISTPRAASFAVTIKLGFTNSPQLDMFEGNIIQNVIDNIITGIDLINKGEEEKLKQLISDDDYYQNFVSLGKNIAPDGDKIKQVGFTVLRNGEQVKLGYTRSKNNFNSFQDNDKIGKEGIIETIKGTLRMADADKGKIKIINSSGDNSFLIEVPEGLTDIVKMFWDDNIIATVSKKKKHIRLIDIEKENS
jgi:hypothetical protein